MDGQMTGLEGSGSGGTEETHNKLLVGQSMYWSK
jgi:hypothetical protein